MQHTVQLSAEERHALERMREADPTPYRRERAAALLKIADGQSAARVARTGLYRRRKPDTLYRWLRRFAADRVAGLTMRPGRGRKPRASPPPHGP